MRRTQDGKIFIPMSIDQNSTVKSSYFMSPMKMAVAMIMLIPGILLGFYAYTETGNNWSAMLITVLIYLFLYSFLIRFFVLEEIKLKKMLKTLESNKISKSDYFWGIEEIDDTGVIHYRYNNGLKKAVVVKVSRGSLIGKPEDFFDRHYEYTLKFVRSLLRNNFSYMKYSKLEPNTMPEGIKEDIKLMALMKDEAQKTVVRMNLDAVSKFTKNNKSVIVDYYVIYNKDIRLMKTFKTIVRDILENSFQGEVYFRDSKMLDTNEITEFISDVLNIRTVSKKGYYDSDSINFDDFGEVFRLFDSQGNEVDFDFDNEILSRNKSDVIEGKQGRSLESIEDEMKRKGLIFDDDEIGKSIFDLDEDDLESTKLNLSKDDIIENEDEYEIIYEDEDGNEVDETGKILKYKDKEKDKSTDEIGAEDDLFNL